MLRRLVGCISTPGDEDEVMLLLAEAWTEAGWHPESFGRQVILARSPDWVEGRPVMLVTAHADSPGFIVSALDEKEKQAVIIKLGYPHLPEEGQWAALTVKTSAGLIESEIADVNPGDREFRISLQPEFQRGDRAVYSPQYSGPTGEKNLVSSPFFDNRIGCWLLTLLAADLATARPQANVILAATASEEFTGFGAQALARKVKADFVVCLDATYEDEMQGVEMGKGPVLTLTDASVLIGHTIEKTLDKLCAEWNIPLQKEIYNYSGTDAKAFAQAGTCAVVLPLLIASQGNHSPLETVSLNDVRSLRELLFRFACGEQAISAMLASNKFEIQPFLERMIKNEPGNLQN